MRTYALVLACANVVWKAVAVVWVAHKDGRLDRLECRTSKGGACATADGVVHDLTALGVSNQDDLSVWTLLVVRSDGLNDSSGSLRS